MSARGWRWQMLGRWWFFNIHTRWTRKTDLARYETHWSALLLGVELSSGRLK